MKIVLALVLVACVAVQAAPAAKKVKGKCRRFDLCLQKGVVKNGKLTFEKGECHHNYFFCPLNAAGKVDDKHCRGVKKPCCHEPCKWKKVGDGHFESDDGEDDGAAKKVKAVCKRLTLTFKPLKKNGKEKKEMKYWLCHDKHCKSVKKCGSGKGKWVKVGDDGHEHFEPTAGDHHHKHKKCKDGDDSDEDGDHKHKRRCKHGDESGDESGGESDGDDDDDDKDEDGDKKKKRKCKKKHGSDGEDSDGSGDSGSDSDHKHGCKKHGSDDSGDDSD